MNRTCDFCGKLNKGQFFPNCRRCHLMRMAQEELNTYLEKNKNND